jgi:hypothetical protein
MRRVPTSVTVLSVIGIIFFFLGLIGVVISLFALFGPGFGPPNPMLNKINNDKGYLIGSGLSLAVGVVGMIILLASSIGSLMLKPWARLGMVTYGVLSLVNAVAGLLFTMLYVVPLMTSALPPNDPGRTGGAIGGAIGGICGGALGMIYPICVLCFFNTASVVQAFRTGGRRDEDEDDYEDQDEDDRRYRDDDRPRRRSRDDDDRFTDRP